MQEKLDALWLEILEPQIDGKVVSYLSSRHPDYKKLRCRQEELVERYPSIIALEVGDDEITLNKREHQALREYMDNQTEMEVLEKSYSVYYAQAAMLSYKELLKKLYQEINRAEECKEDERVESEDTSHE